jgi:hypothetical protein
LTEIRENEQQFTDSLREQLEKVRMQTENKRSIHFTNKTEQVRKDKAALEADLNSRTKAYQATLGQLENATT